MGLPYQALPPAIVETVSNADVWARPAFMPGLPWQLTFLEQRISNEVAAFDGEAAVFYVDLAEHGRVSLNDDVSFYPACLIKLPVLAACFDAFEQGLARPDDVLTISGTDLVEGSGVLVKQPPGGSYSVYELMQLMIFHSDNMAINKLIDHIGMININASFQKMGLTNTLLAHKIMYYGTATPSLLGVYSNSGQLWQSLLSNRYLLPGGNISDDFNSLRRAEDMRLPEEFEPQRRQIFETLRSVRPRTTWNRMNAYDTALLLEKLYQGRAVSPAASRRSISLLKQNRLNDRIPAGLPESVVVAHKTGSTQTVCHDAGIIYTPYGDFALVVLTRNSPRGYEGGRSLIRRIAEISYQYQIRQLLPPYRY